ncbi:hypothetical protein [Leptothoe kymatousa]|uniref:Uncharacterized protein n=1 Tax=Leptothoe kymatousa TAU-MAC 1615 TaxID=2364775 RepID=A0ABS5Y1Q3_9CYAN|nr:hypothetical protein [Leptothoe kymatousa]MBT9311443.1 hypothetical protein [Leptothoe kymatousa TAU-MAC 1615]
MGNKIRYLNTDLELVSASDLTSLVSVFEAMDLCILHCAQYDRLWYATLEVSSQYDEPEATIAEMLAVIESLDRDSRAIWNSCTKREFDIGYECSQSSKPVQQNLSSQLLNRIATVNASLGITLYSTLTSEEPVSTR